MKEGGLVLTKEDEQRIGVLIRIEGAVLRSANGKHSGCTPVSALESFTSSGESYADELASSRR